MAIQSVRIIREVLAQSEIAKFIREELKWTPILGPRVKLEACRSV